MSIIKIKNRKLELVVPAGGCEHFMAAVNSGADSVYLGYKKFGARSFAENFSSDQLKEASAIARKNNIKIYITLNTLIKDREIKEIIFFLEQHLDICNDGIIIQDFGLFKIIRDLFSQIPIHASTQMNVHNYQSVLLLKKLGFKRVVLAREMTLEEITNITKRNILQVEVFGHGSQCFSYSGNCYFSSFVGGRSGNRGRCSQPCRLKYKIVEKTETGFKQLTKENNYLLSKNDLCTLELLPELIEAKIDALKLEGRMKSPEYVEMITKTYRKYIDLYYEKPAKYKIEDQDVYNLNQIFSRKLSIGYLKEKFPSNIISLKRSGSIGNFLGRINKIEYFSRTINMRKSPIIKNIYVRSSCPINPGDVLEIWVKKGKVRLAINYLTLVEEEKNKFSYKIPCNLKETVCLKDRVYKYHDGRIEHETNKNKKFDDKNIKILKKEPEDNQEKYFTNIKIKNYLGKLFQGPGSKNSTATRGKAGIALITDDLQLAEKAAKVGISRIIINNIIKNLNMNSFSSENRLKSLASLSKISSKFIINLPEIIYDSEMDKSKIMLKRLMENGFTDFRISNIGWINLFIEEDFLTSGKKERIGIYLGNRLNIFNTPSVQFYQSLIDMNERLMLKDVEFSLELNLSEIREIIENTSLNKKYDRIAYSIFSFGYPLLMAARIKLEDMINSGSENTKKYFLEDEKGYKFRILNDCFGNLLIFNSKKVCTFFDLDKISESKISNIIIDSNFFNNSDILKILNSYQKAISLIENGKISNYFRFLKNFIDNPLFMEYTKGHCLREVE